MVLGTFKLKKYYTKNIKRLNHYKIKVSNLQL